MLTGRFTRQQRLTQASEFKSVFAKPCVKQGDANMLILGKFNKQKSARLGLAVAKKQLKRAVSRNRFKRLTRESFPVLLLFLEILSGYGYEKNISTK